MQLHDLLKDMRAFSHEEKNMIVTVRYGGGGV